jgi:hypothetical protein
MGDEFSFFDKFGLAWGSERNDVQKAGAWLASRFPIQAFDDNMYRSKEEKEWYYNQATPDQRMEFIRKNNEREAWQRNPKLAQAVAEGNVELGAAGVLGSMAKQLASPTTLIPMGMGYKSLAVGGALLGAEWEVLDQAYNQERFNIGDVTTSAAAGGLLAPAGTALMRQAPKITRALRYADTTKNRQLATTRMQNYEDTMISLLARSNLSDEAMAVGEEGVERTVGSFHRRALERLGIDEDEFLRSMRLNQRDFTLPQSITQARALQEAAEDRLGALIPQYRKPNLIGMLVGNISREAEKIDPRFGQMFRTFDREVQESVYNKSQKIDDWMHLFGETEKKYGRGRVWQAYDQQDEALYAMMSEVGGAERAALARKNFREVMDETYGELTDIVGLPIERLDNYHPTRVKDYLGLADELGFAETTQLDRAREVYKARFNIKGPLTADQNKRFLNHYVRGQSFDPAAKRNPSAQRRKIARSAITADIAERLYEDPRKAIVEYLGRSVNDVKKVTMFGGKQHVALDELGEAIDLDASIGGFLERLRGELVASGHRGSEIADKMDAAKMLVTSRFKMADAEPSEFLRTMRGMAYLSTLPNPMTALVQLGDLGVSAYKYGVVNTLNAMRGKGVKGISVHEMGLGDTIAQEVANVGKVQGALNWTLKNSGFRAMDRLGKNTLLRGAYNAGKKWSGPGANSRQAAAWENRWASRFGEDGLRKLKSDLQNDIMSPEVKDYLWASLAENQPVGKSELPRAYHDNPNARIMYSLKSFMIKQLNFLGQEIADEMKRNPRKAARNMSRYMMTAGVAGLTVNESRRLIMGELTDPEELPEAFAWNMVKMIGLNEYLLNKHGSSNQLGGMVGEIIFPPHAWAVEAVKDVGRIATGEFGDIKSYRNLPLGGNIMYNFFGGGLENKMKYSGSDSWLR